MVRTSHPVWGADTAALRRPRSSLWVDAVLGLALVALVVGILGLAHEWTAPARPTVEIDLSPRALPRYTLYSLARGLVAYGISLAFTLVYGYWAAKSERAGRLLVPILDVLQSIPVLGFMPGVVLALVAAFPRSNLGLELAAVVMIFTGQAWNMTFSFYHSLRSVPPDLADAAATYRFGWWRRLVQLELPLSAIGLVWNSMMSMAGGWFFLMISESFTLGERDYRLPGLGSYMSVAVARGDGTAMALAVLAMALMIVALDQVLWRPLVVWVERFRLEEGGQPAPSRSWMLELLRRSRVLAAAQRAARLATLGRPRPGPAPSASSASARRHGARVATLLSTALYVALLIGLVAAASEIVRLLRGVSVVEWTRLGGAGAATLGRVLASTALGTAWALPAGLAVGLSPRWLRVAQPVAQLVASFPAPMLFPLAVALLGAAGVSLGVGSIVLMLLGTQWYILFNVIAGAAAIPADLREAARSYRLGRLARFRALYFPAVFRQLVTGWVTAAGGAWNASIVAEYVTVHGRSTATWGLGAQISEAAASADFPTLAASLVWMAGIVVVFNRVVWRSLHRLAETRFALAK